MSLTGTSLYSDSSLVSYWKLDGNSIDSKGTNNGTDTSMSYAAGKFESAGVFAGTGFISIGNPTNLQLTTVSTSAWIKTSNAGAGYRFIIGKENAYGVFMVDNVLAIYNWGSFGTAGLKTTGINLADGLWHHVVVTYQLGVTNGTKIYIDGVLKLTTSTGLLDNTHNFCIGENGSTANNQKFNGLIDDCSVFNKVLTDFEINKITSSSNKVFNYLVVGGGGSGGGAASAGGGGAGGLLQGITSLTGTSYSITVGGGGVYISGNGINGQNSIFNGLTAIGGGAGGQYGSNGGTGGSGGGAGGLNGGTRTGGAGTSGQGLAGGNGFNAAPYSGGGGGGAGSVGANGVSANGGVGGTGILNPITGSGYLCGGGGGSHGNSTSGTAAGGSSVGGVGGNASTDGTAGSANTGSGGGGGGDNRAGGNGGSGLVQIKYTTADLNNKVVGGGTITTNGDYTIHTFTSDGVFTIQEPTIIPSIPTLNTATSITHNSFVVTWSVSTDYPAGYYLDVAVDSGFTSFVSGYNNKDIDLVNTTSVTGLQELTTYYVRVRSYNVIGVSDNSNTIDVTTTTTVDYLIVGGGGSGGSNGGGGGGAGGLLQGTNSLNFGSYSIVIGNGGGSGTSTRANGQNSTFNGLTAIGGGYGASRDGTAPSSAGGSGGGGANTSVAGNRGGGAGTAGQGYNGGSTSADYGANGGGAGGGGAASVGSGGAGNGGNGGNGISSSITGTATYYAGGGGAGTTGGIASRGLGGLGGGGNGFDTTHAVTNGTPNTGGGGGAGGGQIGYGGSGVVIIRYKTTSYGTSTGGTKTTDGDYTVHTFTSSGTLVLTEPQQAVVNNGFFVFFYD